MAKNTTSTVTAADNNSTRRAVKARQNAVRKAKAAQRSSEPQILGLEEIRREQRKFSFVQQQRAENGDRLLKQAVERKVLVLKRPEDDSFIWERNCRDTIAAAKRQAAIRFEWNRDWNETGTFMIAPKKN